MVRKVAACGLFFAFIVLAVSAPAFGQVSASVSFGPPALPVYVQPVCPGDGYLWAPGYWAWDDSDGDYYWVPGTWVEPPSAGLFWTPGYWGWGGDAFLFHEGYWGPTVGFYGGINYGFGFFGTGFVGGRWDGGHFFYNREVANVNVNIIHNVYNERVTNVTVNRVSFNGGNGGVNARPTPQEEAAANERHIPPVAAQIEHVQAARANPELRASANHGKPAIAATPRPGAFTDHDVVKAREAGAPYTPPANRGDTAQRAGANASANASAPAKAFVHPKDLPAAERPAAPNTGNPDMDKKYQQQQNKLMSQQNQERQKLQQQQDKEHQQLAKQKADDQQTQQLEQKHQQQTQQMVERHTQQQQDLQRRQSPPAPREGESRPR